MAARRGKSQARRNTGGNNGLPGWAWLVLGLLLGIGLIFAAPKFLKSDGDGFFRPRPNPDARPVGGTVAEEDDALASEDGGDSPAGAQPGTPAKEPEFDFYTVLPGEEVAMTDAQVAATAREERERQTREEQAQRRAAQVAGGAASVATLPPPIAPDRTPAPAAAPVPAMAATTPPASAAGTEARYILQAGAFGASGDAEELKARIALIGLGARVESASINGKTMYRVRMGPYGTASELAEAKSKLGSNGLPAMAIKAK